MAYEQFIFLNKENMSSLFVHHSTIFQIGMCNDRSLIHIKIEFYPNKNKMAPTHSWGANSTCVTVSLAQSIMAHLEIVALRSMEFVLIYLLPKIYFQIGS